MRVNFNQDFILLAREWLLLIREFSTWKKIYLDFFERGNNFINLVPKVFRTDRTEMEDTFVEMYTV